MPTLSPTLTLPPEIELGLLRKEMRFSGGVIQWSHGTPKAGEVVTWLRETQITPQPPSQLAHALGPVSKLVNVGGSVASILNLGATVGFGVVQLRRLKRIETQLAARFAGVEDQLGQLQWTIEWRFAGALQAIDGVRDSVEALRLDAEVERWARLRAAANAAWEAQQLEPGSLTRVARLEHALSQASEVAEFYLARAESNCRELVETLMDQNVGGSPSRLKLLDSTSAPRLRVVRQAALASSLRAAIQAETGKPSISADGLSRDAGRLRRAVDSVGKALVVGNGARLYDDLLQSCHRDAFPVARLGRWAERFDPMTGDAIGVVEWYRGQAAKDLAAVHPVHVGKVQDGKDIWRGLPTLADDNATLLYEFGNVLDGAFEDVERADGQAAEFREMTRMNLAIDEYRRALALPEDIEDDAPPIVFFKKS